MRHGMVLLLAGALAQLTFTAKAACPIGGSYVFALQGVRSDAAGKLQGSVALAGIFIFAPGAGTAQGTVTRSFTIMFNGIPRGDISGSKPTPDLGTVGTFTYGENGYCSAKLSFPHSGPKHDFTETYTMYFTDSGDSAYFVNTTPGLGVSLAGHAERR